MSPRKKIRSEAIIYDIGIKHKIESGTARIFCKQCYGYINDESGELRINDIEAEVARSIFDMYYVFRRHEYYRDQTGT